MTNRIHELHKKINDLLINSNQWTVIDIDLMLDYTRVMYADLLELKNENCNIPLPNGNNISHNKIDTQKSTEVQEIKISEIVKDINIEQSGGAVKGSHGSIMLEMPNAKEDELNPELNGQEATHDTNLSNLAIEPGEIFNAKDNQHSNPIVQNDHIVKPIPEKKEIRKFIGINDKYLFMNELFNNDKFDYESVLDYINQAHHHHAVLQWLEKEYIINNKWNKDDQTVSLFYGVVDKYFSNFK